jgi:hypothetical protein
VNENDDQDSDESENQFPIGINDRRKIDQVIALIRRQLASMAPSELRTAAAVLLALERLPTPTRGVDIVFGFTQPNRDGNYGWADLEISAEELRFGMGEHFYDPAMGGDTASRTAFEAVVGADAFDGDIDDWLPVASVIANGGEISIEDFSEYDEIDWEASDAERDFPEER